ncbi:uncharacterized protein C9orf152 homolog isoform X2 [Phascolarctos cinereus]|uniref:Uncharacterized protein C9orf152 homolog isoform X2 n=1 Tax=Phascolarctos cinereus TaxID=38626 RepID=A0A6P5ID06_PHACI|nr:uncharacterized protein C9orf152 homolog isoform X2 [Phascolarctos cinereus]
MGSRSDENCAGGSKKERRAPLRRGPRLEATVRPDTLGTGSIQDPWRTHLAIHRLRHSTCWKTLPLPTARQPASDPWVPLEEGANGRVPPNQDPQKEPPQLVTPAPGGAPQGMKSPAGPGGASHYPFPKRKGPHISEAARRLGLYRPT